LAYILYVGHLRRYRFVSRHVVTGSLGKKRKEKKKEKKKKRKAVNKKRDDDFCKGNIRLIICRKYKSKTHVIQ
jgi:DNA modification methylase